MKTRYKSPNGNGIIEFPEDATIETLFAEIQKLTGIQNFTIKYGLPGAMKSVGAESNDKAAKAFRLHGETVTIVPNETAPHVTNEIEQLQSAAGTQYDQKREKLDPQEVVVPWPEREGSLVLRVMPSDNSCLFTSFGGALPNQLPPHRLRQMMAEYILEHQDDYNEAILGATPTQYSQSIVDPDRWGGGIELSILSTIFDLQICTYDIQTKNLIAFGENKAQRCILAYSGIHYDRVAFSLSEPPFDAPMLPPETDRTMWPTDDDEVLQQTEKLIQGLHDNHYFTDMDGLILKCDVPGCGWIGSGETEGRKHAEATGHVDLSEVQDVEADNTLRTCDAPGCDFIGAGDKVIRKHTTDSGHTKFSIIPDL